MIRTRAKAPGLTQRAYEQLHEAIVGGRIGPGEALFEVNLAESLGMSRTPVREALRVLEREGLVEALPSRGYRVPHPSIEDLRELFEMRETLEGMAARYAALRATELQVAHLLRLCGRYERERGWDAWTAIGSEFHDAIVAAAGNVRLRAQLASLNSLIVMSRRSALRADGNRRQTAIAQHRAIFEAIRARDAELAQRLACEHVRHSYEATLRIYGDRAYTAASAR